jgi:glutamine synthetase
MPGQWEYQVGPCLGIEIGDHLWMSRYLLSRIGESYNMTVSLEPKLFPDWNGSGCHTNYSTKTMREGTGGMKYIDDMMVHFDKAHSLHMKLYGEGNSDRLTGIHETSSFTKFSYGAGNRAASFRIPTSVMAANGKGYIEDRRPASNICPYIVGSVILSTSCLNGLGTEPMVEHYDKWTTYIKE